MDLLNSLISEKYIHAIGWTLVHSIWQIVLISLALWLVIRWASARSSQFRYMAGLIALMVIIITTGFTFQHYMDQQDPTEVTTPGEALVHQLVPHNFTPTPPASPSQNNLEFYYIEPLFPLLTNFWLMGSLFFFIRLFGSIVAIQSLDQKHGIPFPADLQKKTEGLKTSLGIHRKLSILESQIIHVPITYGILKPIILIPCSLLIQISPKQLEAIIAHELAHIKRYDYLVNILQSCMEVFFFFHPCFWWINDMVRKERENAFDDTVLKLGFSPSHMAHGLATIAEINNANAPDISLATHGPQPTLNRIKRLLGFRTPKESPSPLITLTIIFFWFLVLSCSWEPYLQKKKIPLLKNH
ncbi:M56 family metallopeptidase [Echinicola jeungdonensis]|uniref:M56 family metallopeptidase n=1 Tax=Echinicola jeungdonensis TaxID=709343 RepID=A0ABV5J7P2_9BACT|nr:M56 family metallopeptidase [Echinicola jeungdonensis]MDN3669685.1 M56 family metallopeptidase [Echinicola jeungdonensis]